MATFGKTSIGATAFSVFANEIDSTWFTMPEDGDVTAFNVYCSNPDTVQLGFKITARDGASAPTNLVVASPELLLPAGSAAAWRVITLGSSVRFTGGLKYWLGHFGVSGTPTTGIKVYGDNAGAGAGWWEPDTYSDGAAAVRSGGAADTNAYSIYATYTPVGSSGARSRSLHLGIRLGV